MDCPVTLSGSPPKPRPRREWRLALVCLAVGVAGWALAQPLPLAPDKAFRFDARALNPQTIEARFSIADGYYLYRDRIHFSVEPAAISATVPALPEGKVKQDPFFGRVETFRGGVQVNIALKDTSCRAEGRRRRRVAGMRRRRHLLPRADAARYRRVTRRQRSPDASRPVQVVAELSAR